MVTRDLTQPLALFDERRRNLIRVLSGKLYRGLPEMKPALSAEPTTKDTFLALAAGKSWASAFL